MLFKKTKECMNAEGFRNYEASTPMHEGDAFGDFQKINNRHDSLRLNNAYEGYCWGCGPKALHGRSPQHQYARWAP
jgi:hypothetical protein